MERKIIYTENAPEPGPYSQAVKYGHLIFVAGQTSEDPKTNHVVHGSVSEQTEIILNNIKSILEAAGSGMERVLRADVFISSMDVKDEMNKV